MVKQSSCAAGWAIYKIHVEGILGQPVILQNVWSMMVLALKCLGPIGHKIVSAAVQNA